MNVKISNPSEGISGARGNARRGNAERLIPIVLLILVAAIGGGVYFWFQQGPGAVSDAYLFSIERFSGKTEAFLGDTGNWQHVTRANMREIKFGPGDAVKTIGRADVDLKLLDTLDLRVKPATALAFEAKAEPLTIRMTVSEGILLGITGNAIAEWTVQIESPHVVTQTRGGAYLLSTDTEKQLYTLTMLDGAATVSVENFEGVIKVPALHMIEIGWDAEALPEPKRVTYQSWRAVNEIRDLVYETREQAAEQLDLRKQAGNLFKYVFDEGAFFTPNLGYVKREFIQDETGQVQLRVDYDVYPDNSFAGVYLKTRDFDLSKVKRLAFELRSDASHPTPDGLRVELKRRLETVRGFAVKPITSDWQLYSYDFKVPKDKPTPVTEVVLVIENTRIGPLARKGTVYVKNFTVE